MDDSHETRTVAYAGAATVRAEAAGRDGREILQARERGETEPPPVERLVNITGIELTGDGGVELTCEPHESLYNPNGGVQGGIIASWLDAAMGAAVRLIVPRGQTLTTADLQVHFFKPVTEATGRVRCAGSLLHRGKTLVTAQARLTDERGELLAQATSTCVLISDEPPGTREAKP